MRLPPRAATVATLLAFSAGGSLVLMGLRPTGPPRPDPSATPVHDTLVPWEVPPNTTRPGPARAPAGRAISGPASTRTGVGLARSLPVSLAIPAIGLRANLSPVGLVPDGSIDVPPARLGSIAGWYRDGASPGEIGPALVVGHVDSARDGPAVFFRLGDLRPGDPLSVRRSDGIIVRFRITAVREYPKSDFPDREVYGPVPRPEIRLITCGGDFDSASRSYRDSVVVFALMISAG